MTNSQLELDVLPETFAVVRLTAHAAVPAWATGELVSVTRTPDELSIVCDEENVPTDATAQRGWRALRVRGPLDFALTGILAAIAVPLAKAGVSIFAVSTFDTDYVLIRTTQLETAIAALNAAGVTVG